MIKATNISKKYGALEVLKSVNLEINKGELVAIIGPSGAGKTTLLQILGTLDYPDTGSLEINGETVNAKWKDDKISSFRNKNIGFVFQFHNLLPEFTALENVLIAGMISGKKKSDLIIEARSLFKVLGIENRENNKPSQLSGGEKQRVAIARALINKPALILADEPTGNLDSETASEINLLFKKLAEELNQTVIVVTHSIQLADTCHRKLEMVDGQFVS